MTLIVVLRVLLVAIALLGLAGASQELIKFSISSYIVPDKKLSMELDVVMPRRPNSYPVILFMTGLSGIAPSASQERLIESVAEEGFIWMTVPLP